jgi:hypothetical protein
LPQLTSGFGGALELKPERRPAKSQQIQGLQIACAWAAVPIRAVWTLPIDLENNKQMNGLDRRVSVAPMMDRSDRRNSR